MAFDEAIDVGNVFEVIEFTSQGYVSDNAKMFFEGTIDLGTSGVEGIEYSDETYVYSGAKLFFSGTVEVFNGDIEFGTGQHTKSLDKVFNGNTLKIYLNALPNDTGDDSKIIIFGTSIDFSADPRYGSTPLLVRFTNLSVGTFDKFLWDFGDGKTSESSAPVHIYRTPGVYDVILQCRIEEQWLYLKKRLYIYVYDGRLNVSRTNKSFSFAIDKSQGVMFCENTGHAWPMPECGEGPVMIWDENDHPHSIVFDNNDGKFYDTYMRDGPEGSGIVNYHKDKVDENGDGGTDIIPSVKFGGERGTYEHYFIKLAAFFAFLRCYDDKYRGATGYDSNGFPTGLSVNLQVFVDGERSTASREVTDIPITGHVHTDGDVEGHQISAKLIANMGAHKIVGRKIDFVTTDRLAGSGVMSEDDYQNQCASPVLWFSREPISVNRATGGSPSATELAKMAECSGPDGRSNSAFQFTEAVTLDTISISGGSIRIWTQSLSSLQIGETVVSLTTLDSIGSWNLQYATGITASGEVVVTPSGTGKVFDLMIVSDQLFSEAALNFYFGNVEKHNGDSVLP